MELWIFPGINDDVPSLSPFCHKAHAYLTMVGVDFDLVEGDPRKSPNKKLPVLVHDGTVIADSQKIIEYGQTHLGDDMDDGLSDSQHARGHVLRRAIEDGYYFVMLYAHWVDDVGWAVMKERLKPMLPPVIGGVIAPLIRKSVIKSCYLQGISRLSREEVYALGRRDLDTLAEMLTTHDFAVGDEPSSYDSAVFGFVMNTIGREEGNPLRDYAVTLPTLVEYCDRMKARFFS